MTDVFQEVSLVLSAGRFGIVTSTSEQTSSYRLNEYFPKAMRRTNDQTPGRDEIVKALQNAGFEKIHVKHYEVSDDLEDFFLCSGKHSPELHLDPRMRSGISTFVVLAESEEIEGGCRRLESDIRSGHIRDVVASYDVKGEGD